MKKAVQYLRISRPSGRDESTTDDVENQRMANQNFAKTKNLEIVREFVDMYVSGAIPARQRRGYQQMLEFCESEGIRVIITYDISRLSRGDFIDGLNELRQLTQDGYTVYFSSQPFLHEIDDPILKNKIISDFLWFAQLYREDVRRKTIQGLKRAIAEGKKLGRPKREINWKRVQRYREMGLSYSAISRLMDIPYSTLIKRKKEIERGVKSAD